MVPNSYTLQTVIDSSVDETLNDLSYGDISSPTGLYQIQVDITGSTYNLTLKEINASTREVISSNQIVTGGNLSTGKTAVDFESVNINWDLASGNPAEPGSNYIIVNQLKVTSTSN